MLLTKGPISVVEAIDRTRLQEVDKERNYMGLSSVGRCRRQTYYYYYDKEYPFERDAKVLRIFDDGNNFESYIVGKMKEAGFKVFGCQYEVSWPGLPNVKGHIDGLLGNNDETYLMEVKTAHPNSFNKLLKSHRGVEDTWPDYFAQTQAYLHGLNEAILSLANKGLEIATRSEYDEGGVYNVYTTVKNPITWVVFLVKDKGSGDIAEQWVEYDYEYVMHSLRPRIEELWRMIENRQVPPADYNPRSTDWQCRICPVKAYCKEE